MIEKLEQECWCLDYNLANHILPRLLYFKNWCEIHSHPSDLNADDWDEILDEMIWAFTYVSKNYPKTSDNIIEDVNIIFKEKTEQGFISSTIEMTFKDGYTEKDYEICQIKDQANINKCQIGLNLFSKYYMSLWN